MKYRNIICATLVFPAVVYSSTSIRDAVSNTLLHNPDILSYQKNNKATRLYIDEAEGAYYPSVDLDLRYESEDTYEKEPDTTDIDEGPEVTLSISQTLYDGSLNYNTVLEKKHDYNEVFYENKSKTEDLVLNAINAYLDLKMSQEMIVISKDNITEHERILEIAKENEDISGEVIDRLQAESKTYAAYNNLNKEEQDNKRALSEYLRIIGVEPIFPVCRPTVREELLPSNLDRALEESLQKNLEIKAQLEAIFKQRAIFAQEKSRFLPNIKANFEASKDKDITTDDTTTTVYTSSITLSYNLFNGTQDINSYEREKIFLFESQKTLDSVTKSVEDQITQAYNSYNMTKEKIVNLEKYAELKKEILQIYQEQFEGGTRTIIDLLSEASELYRARQELITEEFQLIKYYYEMLLLFGNLSDIILDDTKQVCVEEKYKGLFDFGTNEQELSLDDELASLLGESSLSENIGDEGLLETTGDGSLDGLLEESNSDTLQEYEAEEIQNVETTDTLVDQMLEKLLAEAYKNDEKDYLVVDDDSVKIQPRVIGSETFKDRFLAASADHYTINVIAFGSMEKASQFIKENLMDSNSFAFQYGKKLNLFKVVYGVFETYDEAKNRLDMLSFPEKYYPIIEKVGKKQELYKKYNIDYEIPSENIQNEDLTEELDTKESSIKPVVINYPPIENDNNFKASFLSVNKEYFTINVYTFLSESLARDFVTNYSLADNSFLFRFGKNKKLIKLVYGVYKTIGEANKDLAKIKTIGDNVHPVVEKVYKQRNIYKRFYDIEEELELAKTNSNAPQNKKVLAREKSKELLNSEFLNGSSENYTINIATISSIDKARWFVDRYKLEDDALVYQFGENSKYTKILYGVYKSYEEAVSAMSTLDTDILINRPHIEKIKKHQELYKKYSEE